MLNERPAPTTPEYAAWYADYLRSVSTTDAFQRYKQRSFHLIGATVGGNVLDVGCGVGQDVAALAELVGPSGSVTGVDHDPEMVTRARATVTIPNARFEVADARSLPFGDNTFDALRIDRVLMHVTRAEAAIAEAFRVLRPGARAVAIEPDWDTCAVDLADLDLGRRVLDARSRAYPDAYIGRRLWRIFHEAGFSELRAEPFVVVNTDYAEGARGVRLAGAAQFGRRDGTLNEDDAARWDRLIAQAATAPTFFSMVTMVMVVGTR